MLKSWRLWVSLTDPWECHILPTPVCLFKWWSSLFIPQTIVGTLIPALVILLSSYSHTWATGSWWIPPVPLPAGAPWESSGKLASPHFRPLFGLNWYSWKDKIVLIFSHAPRKRREDRSSLSPFLSLSPPAVGRSGPFLAYTHGLHMLNLCQWYTSFGLWPHITHTCGAIYSFLRYFLQKPSLF